MDKLENVIAFSAVTRDRVDKLIRAYKVGIAKDILKERLEIGDIDTIEYGRELESLYSALGFGGTE